MSTIRPRSPICGVAAFLAVAAAFARDPERLTIMGADYPRVFYFRASEGACSERRYPTYEDWERNFDGLMGIMGKCLMEECLGREPRNPEFFAKFKRRHPEQVVLLHFNGNSRDPLYQRDTFFPGHWIYRKAVMITEDVPAEAGESVIKVADARGFRVDSGRYKTHNDDIALFGLKDGKHDWYHCEHVQLVAVDREAKTITVKRGCYGSEPLAFRAGESRAAPHQVEGPWGQNNHFLWYYNYSTHCPRDREGKTCADRLVDDLARWFGEGGVLGAFDGLEFDVLFNLTHGDTDGDGEEDHGLVGGRNNYGVGVVEFGRQLRERMGEEFIIQADGALGRNGERSQRNWGNFNGIESEGWPHLGDWEVEDWSGGLNRHFFWRRNARPPVFNYINHKWVQAIPDRPGHHRQADAPFSRHRLVFAAGQFTDAMVCYSSVPKPPPCTGYTYWCRDVTVAPDATLAFSTGMGALSPERSDGVWFKVLATELTAGQPAEFKLLFEKPSKEFTWLPHTVSLAAYAGKTVRLKFVADCGPNDDATTDHASWSDVRVESGGRSTSLVSEEPPTMGMCIRGRTEEAIGPKTGARVEYDEALDVGGELRPAYAVHPPYRNPAGPGKFPIWDEFVRGTDNELGWLGKPEAPPVHLATLTPDLLAGAGRGAALVRRIAGDVSASAGKEGVTVRARDPDDASLRFTIRDVPADGPDLFVSVTMKGECMTGYPREMARFATVAAAGGMVNVMAGKFDATGMCLRGEAEQAIDNAAGARVTRMTRNIDGKALPAIFAHPPYGDGTGYTFWERETDVSADAELRFSVGMGPLSPERSDGVWFKVHVATVADGETGTYREVHETSSKAHKWIPHAVSLAEFAGKRVRLKFIADAGPADDSTTDHASWGDVKIVAAGTDDSRLTKAVPYMTWVNDTPFSSGFYYRHIRSGKVDLSFTVESPEPVVIGNISVHAYPDAMCRLFEKGLVLANPGRKPYTFDLNAISPGRGYRRIQATALQDTVTNNGQPVGDKVTLGERDAIFLLRTK